MTMDKKEAIANLAVNGGSPAVDFQLPARFHFGKEEKEAVNKLFDQAVETGNAPGYNGPAEEQYCRDFAEFMGGGFADAVNSGTTAVYVALKALNPEPFTEIIVGCVTDPGGMMPIPLLNCIPVVADAMPGCYNTGPAEIEKLISPRTSAIVVAHIGGEPADIIGIVELAKKHNIPVVEDCAQAHGTRINGQHVGTFGDIGAFSTMFGKHHCTGGQGGVVFTRNEDLYWRAKRASDRGKAFNLEGAHGNCVASLNYNLNDLAGAIGSVQLKKLPEIVRKRQKFAAMLSSELSTLKTIDIPEVIPGGEHSYWWWRLKVNCAAISCSKAEFCQALQAEGVSLAANYSAALPHTFDWFKNKSVFGSSNLPWSSPEYQGDPDREYPCPNAMASMECQFNLSVYESWGEKEAQAIIKAFRKVSAAYEN